MLNVVRRAAGTCSVEAGCKAAAESGVAATSPEVLAGGPPPLAGGRSSAVGTGGAATLTLVMPPLVEGAPEGISGGWTSPAAATEGAGEGATAPALFSGFD